MKVVCASSLAGAGRRLLPGLALLLGLAVVVPRPVDAQYFGRNKVQYDAFDFRVLQTDHFDIHFYPEEGRAIEDVARMSERWYERLARSFQHEFERRKPLIFYADHPDFQQTNTLQGMIGESTGGVTESLKNRVIMPLTGSYADTDHVLGHELVHAFQYNIAQSRRGGGLQGLSALPLWLIEGMAEYLSVGREDPLTAMWLRDAVRREDFPTIRDMTRERRFFPYRFGQALWAYIGGEYGDAAVTELFRRSLRGGFQRAVVQVLGTSADTLSMEWRRQVEQAYVPLMANRSDPDSVGEVILSPATGSGTQNVSPALSPDGQYVAFHSEKDLFSVDLFLANARTGEIIRKLASAAADPHADAIRYVEAAGTWSPDAEYFAYAVFANGDNEIVIIRRDNGNVWQRIQPEGLGAVNNPAWSPDGRYLVFTGFAGGISDLYMWDLEDEVLTQLTNDEHADFQPTWSPDGRTIAFSSDRGPGTDFQKLTYSDFQLALLDVATQRVEVLDVLGDVRHSNPQFAPDGENLYFLSDRDGFSDIYRVDLSSRQVRRLTRVATGVSGITGQSPALSVARLSGDVAFSVFNEFEFHIHTLPPSVSGEAVPTTLAESELRGRRLPPAASERYSFVADYLADASTGLPDPGRYVVTDATGYSPSLELDYLGQPTIGAGTDRFGAYAGGGASAFFSDMLGNKFLAVAFQAQGTLKDIGGQVAYQDVSDRWNWALGAGHIPYLLQGWRPPARDEQGNAFVGLLRQRVLVTSGSGILAYPFSSTRRVEFSAGVTRYGIDLEEDRFILDPQGRIIDVRRVNLDDQEPDAVTLVEASAAWVGDNTFFGFTSPVRGKRFRLELKGTQGDYDFVTAIADWRRYWQVDRNLTVALRGLHYGRYGNLDTDPGQLDIIRPLFLGFETLIRGYASESFDQDECVESQGDSSQSCPTFSRLFGDRLGVVNLEARVPLLGVEQYGLINFPFLPTELVFFQDAGVAWSADESATLEFSRSSSERVPVFSTGVGARFNVLGFLILEAYYAQPWQRTFKGPHWGFSLAPGW